MMPPAEHIPSRYAILPYYALAALLFVITTSLCIAAAPAWNGHYFQPKLLAITHLAVLGWATMIIFGATNQLAPVITEQRLFSQRLPLWILLLLVVGLSLLIPSFWFFSLGLPALAGGLLLLTAIVLHAWNIYRTTRSGKESPARYFLQIAHLWLLLTATMGMLLLINLRYPFLPEEHLHYLKIHGSIGMGGWFLQLIIGVSSRLIPMFLLSRNEETKWLDRAYYLINISLVLFLVEGVALHSERGRPVYFLILTTGIVCYFIYVCSCYRSAIKKQMDSGMKQTMLGLLLLVVPFVLLTVQWFLTKGGKPNIISAYGFSFFAGFISTIIMGQTFKTLPFIIWMHITGPGQLPERLPKDLYSEVLVTWQMYLFLSGNLTLLSGILMNSMWLNYVGAILMTIAATMYFCHVFFILLKLRNNEPRHKRPAIWA